MPIHDWSKVAHGTFHHFHTLWVAHLSEQLNRLLPPDYYAMAEQHFGTGIGDVVALTVGEDEEAGYLTESAGGTLTIAAPNSVGIRIADRPPRVTQHLILGDSADVPELDRRIVVRKKSDHRIIAIVEIVSPGNRSSRSRLQLLLDKTMQAIRNGVHVLLLDLLPPGTLDRHGMHNEIWIALGSPTSQVHPDRPLTLVSYLARLENPEAFVEPTAVGLPLIPMPLFLEHDQYIDVPLEESYLLAWQGVPLQLRPTLMAPT